MSRRNNKGRGDSLSGLHSSQNKLGDLLSTEQQNKLIGNIKTSEGYVLEGIPLRFVTDAEALEGYTKKWSSLNEIAVDFEFDDNKRKFGRRISVGQFFDGDEIILVDFLQIRALKPLLQIFENDKIKKIFHSCNSDLLLLDELHDCRTKNVEDTSLMFKIAFDYGQDISLKNSLQQTLEIEIEKEEQTSNWLERPLRDAQIQYAAKAVCYLFRMRDFLKDKLGETKFKIYEKQRRNFDKLRFRKNHEWQQIFVKKHKLNRRETFYAYKLLQIRENVAKKCDRPRYMVLSDEKLVNLVRNFPKDLSEWKFVAAQFKLIASVYSAEELFEMSKIFYLPENQWGFLPEDYIQLLRKSQTEHRSFLIKERENYVQFLKEYNDAKKTEGKENFSLSYNKLRDLTLYGTEETLKEGQAREAATIFEENDRDPMLLAFSIFAYTEDFMQTE